jgi:hypothetical protein
MEVSHSMRELTAELTIDLNYLSTQAGFVVHCLVVMG